ncbi:MAG TPA: LysR substrate-binding domain-containing protein, partial [Archangium sp.]
SLRGPVTADDLSFMRGLVLAGVGIGLLPIHFTQRSKSRLERVLPDWQVSGVGVHLVMPAQKYVPARVRLLSDFIYENFKAEACSKHG